MTSEPCVSRNQLYAQFARIREGHFRAPRDSSFSTSWVRARGQWKPVERGIAERCGLLSASQVLRQANLVEARKEEARMSSIGLRMPVSRQLLARASGPG